MLKEKNTEQRASEILDVIMSYARLDFSVKTNLYSDGGTLDAIASGVNMLGEELKNSSISLKEKDQLLREIHHRVKNNMQIISSLLNLQSENEKDKRLLTLIKDSRSRINAMAFVHEMLYATADFKFTNFSSYVKKLTASLAESYAKNASNVQFAIEIDKEIKFDVDTMIPLGLILNEAITNSFKYAFKKGKQKKCIEISLVKTNNKFQLSISDNGVGLPPDFNSKKQTSLGVQLIFLLAKQIGGKIKIAKTGGTSYVLTF